MAVRLEAYPYIKQKYRVRIKKHCHQTPFPMHTFIVIMTSKPNSYQSFPFFLSLSLSLSLSFLVPLFSSASRENPPLPLQSSTNHLDQKVQTATTRQTRHHRRADALPGPGPAPPPVRVVPLRRPRLLVVHPSPPTLRRVSAPVSVAALLLRRVAVALRWAAAVAAVLVGVSDLVRRGAVVVLVGDGGAEVVLLLLWLGRRVGARVCVGGRRVGGRGVFVRHRIVFGSGRVGGWCWVWDVFDERRVQGGDAGYSERGCRWEVSVRGRDLCNR